jgi:hypothetical protein
MLQQLKNDVTIPSSSIHIHEDPTQTLVAKMYLVTAKEYSRQIERFGESFGNVHIEENGLVARHCGPKNSNVYVRGIGEYSSGIHKIRFLFKKTSTRLNTWFSVVSQLMPIGQNTSDSPYTDYGWISNDHVRPSDAGSLVQKDFRDMRGETTFEIELELDCDSRKVSYVNQGTKNRRELNVDITKCPFPWHFQCYLYKTGDCVRLLP